MYTYIYRHLLIYMMYQRQQNTLYPTRWQILRNPCFAFSRFMSNPEHHKLKTVPILQAVNQLSASSNNCVLKLCYLRG